jgi:glutamyl/glutaminyl-tRNA synthetase
VDSTFPSISTAREPSPTPVYRGRLAPSPTGLLHLGHARTFWLAAQRAHAAGGELHLRNDDLDRGRCRPEFVAAMQEDLRWLGLSWNGPIITQSERLDRYRAALVQLHAAGLVFPCHRSRRDVLEAASAPHEGPEAADDEPLYPREFRPPADARFPAPGPQIDVNWRFRVPDGEEITFHDARLGPQRATAGRDFGDFLVWRKDDLPSYQLACAVDDAELGITEVVRGEDLIRSTFRQLLLLDALGHAPPAYCHCPLLRDDAGVRLAKRHDALSLRTLRARGVTPGEIIAGFRREAASRAPAV